MNKTKEQDKIIAEFKKNIEAFEIFQKNIRNFFESRALSRYVHSVRHRIKDIDHLIEKIERKNRQDKELPIEQQKGLITAEKPILQDHGYRRNPRSSLALITA